MALPLIHNKCHDHGTYYGSEEVANFCKQNSDGWLSAARDLSAFIVITLHVL
jgi:hypothetical protein